MGSRTCPVRWKSGLEKKQEYVPTASWGNGWSKLGRRHVYQNASSLWHSQSHRLWIQNDHAINKKASKRRCYRPSNGNINEASSRTFWGSRQLLCNSELPDWSRNLWKERYFGPRTINDPRSSWDITNGTNFWVAETFTNDSSLFGRKISFKVWEMLQGEPRIQKHTIYDQRLFRRASKTKNLWRIIIRVPGSWGNREE